MRNFVIRRWDEDGTDEPVFFYFIELMNTPFNIGSNKLHNIWNMYHKDLRTIVISIPSAQFIEYNQKSMKVQNNASSSKKYQSCRRSITLGLFSKIGYIE